MNENVCQDTFPWYFHLFLEETVIKGFTVFSLFRVCKFAKINFIWLILSYLIGILPILLAKTGIVINIHRTPKCKIYFFSPLTCWIGKVLDLDIKGWICSVFLSWSFASLHLWVIGNRALVSCHAPCSSWPFSFSAPDAVLFWMTCNDNSVRRLPLTASAECAELVPGKNEHL